MRSIGSASRLPNDQVYMQFQQNRLVEQREILKRYIINDSINRITWHLTDSVKSILGYHCNQATTVLDGKKITAWYTTSIPVPSGPYNYCGLPDLILFINEDEGHVQFIAKEISKVVNVKEIKEPVGGKLITRKELNTILGKISGVIR